MKKTAQLLLAFFIFLAFVQCDAPVKFLGKNSVELSGTLYKPEGIGPFPAVVLMHGCGGDHDAYHSWAVLLKQAGYVAFVLDSFKTRGVVGVCGRPDASPNPKERVKDAFDAQYYLSSLPFVDSKKIALIGWSHGGVSALIASLKVGETTPAGLKPFAAVIAFYPYCFEIKENFSLSSPLLILIGSADDWTPSKLCQTYEQKLMDKKQDVALKVYPGATHAFDFGVNVVVQGHVLNYDPKAAEDAKKQVIDFLKNKLK